MFVTSCFPRAAIISSAAANSLLLITPLDVFSLSCMYAQHLVVRKLFILSVLAISTSKFPFHVFVTFLEVALVAITFSIKKDENLARQTYSKDSMTINLGKSATSFSKFDLDKFLFVFLLEDAISDVYFLLALCSTINYGIQLVLGMYQGGNLFTLV